MLKGTKAIGMLAAGIVLYTGMTVSATGTGNAPVPSAGVGEILEAKLQEEDYLAAAEEARWKEKRFMASATWGLLMLTII